MKFLIATIPAAGHFNPTVPIARRLRELGHDVAYTSGRSMEPTVRALDFSFFPNPHTGPSGDVDDEVIRRFARSHRTGELLAIGRLASRTVVGLTRGLMEVMESQRPDALLIDVNAAAAITAAEKLRLPWASSSEFPGMLHHPDYPPYLGRGWPSDRTPLNRLRWRAGVSVAMPLLRWSDRAINANRRELGLPPREYNLVLGPISPYLYLAYTIEELEFGRREWPAQVHFVGPSLWDRPDGVEAPPWLAEMVGSGRPLVYVTLGTLQGGAKGRWFFDRAVKALADGPWKVVMTTGDGTDDGADPPAPNIRVAGYLPQSLLLPHCSAAISQGGFGTCVGALWHGVPLLLAPVWGDQFENAQRYVEAGVGRRLDQGRLTSARIRRELEGFLTDEPLRANAARMASLLQARRGPERAADLLIRMAENRAPVLRDEPATEREASRPAR